MRILLILLLLTVSVLAQTPQLSQPGGYEHYLDFLSNRLLGVSNSREYWLWDLHTRRLLAHETGLTRVLDRGASPDGRYLVVTDYPSTAHVYALPEVRRMYTYQPQNPNPDGAYEVFFSSDGRSMLLLGSAHGPVNCDSFVRQVDLASGRETRRYDFGHKRSNRSSILTGKGMRMARGAGSKLQIWDLNTGRKLREVQVPEGISWLRQDGQGILCSGGGIYSWDDLSLVKKVPDQSSDSAHSPDGKLSWRKTDDHFLVVRNADQKVLYEGPTSHELEHWLSLGFQIYPRQPGNRVDPVYNFEGQKIGTLPRIMLGYPGHPLVTDQPGYGGPVVFYDYQKLRQIGRIPFGTSPQYSPDGKTLAILTKEGVLLIDIQASIARGQLVPSR